MAKQAKSLRYATSHTPPPSRPNLAVATLFVITAVGMYIVGIIAVLAGGNILVSSDTDMSQFTLASLFSTRWLPLEFGAIILLVGTGMLFAAFRLFGNSRWFTASNPRQNRNPAE